MGWLEKGVRAPAKRKPRTAAENAEKAERNAKREANLDEKIAALLDPETQQAVIRERRLKAEKAFQARLKKAPTPQSRLKAKKAKK